MCFFLLFNTATRKFSITYVPHIIFLLNNAAPKKVIILQLTPLVITFLAKNRYGGLPCTAPPLPPAKKTQQLQSLNQSQSQDY